MKNNRNLVLIFAILLVTIAAVFIFKPKPDDNDPVRPDLVDAAKSGKVMVYFNKERGSEVVTEPVVRSLPEELSKDSKEVMSYALLELLNGPKDNEKDEGFFTEIPEGTRLLSVTETPKAMYIDLSGAYTTGGGSNSMIQRLNQVTKTVVSVPQKKPVYLKVEGKQLDVLGGEGIMVNEPITSDPSVSQ